MKDRPVVVVGRGLGSIVGAHGRVRVERGGLYPDGGDAEPPESDWNRTAGVARLSRDPLSHTTNTLASLGI